MYPRNPYFEPIYSSTGLMWGDTLDSHISGYKITPANKSFAEWAQEFTDPVFREQFGYVEPNGQHLNALPSLTSLSMSGYFRQFSMTPAEEEWLGYNIAREQEAMDDHGASDLTVLSILSAPFVSWLVGPAATGGEVAAYSEMAAAESALATQTVTANSSVVALDAGTGFYGGIDGAAITSADIFGGSGSLMPPAVPEVVSSPTLWDRVSGIGKAVLDSRLAGAAASFLVADYSADRAERMAREARNNTAFQSPADALRSGTGLPRLAGSNAIGAPGSSLAGAGTFNFAALFLVFAFVIAYFILKRKG